MKYLLQQLIYYCKFWRNLLFPKFAAKEYSFKRLNSTADLYEFSKNYLDGLPEEEIKIHKVYIDKKITPNIKKHERKGDELWLFYYPTEKCNFCSIGVAIMRNNEPIITKIIISG